jgi:hypothetical protein
VNSGSGFRRWYRTLGAIQERFEASVAGQAFISAIVVMILLIGVVWSLPASTIQRSVAPPLRPAALALGLDQDWGVFAPGPPLAATTIEVHVLVEGDAARRTWRPPHGNPVYGQYSWYRWQKFKEWVLVPSSGLDLPDFAHWVVRDVTRSTEHPTYVEVVERVDTLPPPGSSAASKRFHRVVYSEHLSGRP